LPKNHSTFSRIAVISFCARTLFFRSNVVRGKNNHCSLFSLLFYECTALISICVVIYFCASITYVTRATHIHLPSFFSCLLYEYSSSLVKSLSFYNFAVLSYVRCAMQYARCNFLNRNMRKIYLKKEKKYDTFVP